MVLVEKNRSLRERDVIRNVPDTGVLPDRLSRICHLLRVEKELGGEEAGPVGITCRTYTYRRVFKTAKSQSPPSQNERMPDLCHKYVICGTASSDVFMSHSCIL